MEKQCNKIEDHLEIPNGAQGLRLTRSWALGFICFVMSISVLPEMKKKHSPQKQIL